MQKAIANGDMIVRELVDIYKNKTMDFTDKQRKTGGLSYDIIQKLMIYIQENIIKMEEDILANNFTMIDTEHYDEMYSIIYNVLKNNK